MKRYSFYENQGIEPNFLDFRFAVRTQEDAALVRETSLFLHDFQMMIRGGQRHKNWSERYAWLDMDYLAVSCVAHTYYAQDRQGNEFNPVLVQPELFDGVDFDLRVICGSVVDAVEVTELSRYLDDYKVKMKGRGTKKPGSIIYKIILDENRNLVLEPVLRALMSLHQQPEKLIVGDTRWASDWK